MKNKRLIVMDIFGGIGNQMFIYATSKKIEVIVGQTVKYDPAYYLWWPIRKTHARKFDLDKFDVTIDIADNEEIRKLIWRTKNRYANIILKRHNYFSKKFARLPDFLKNKSSGDIYLSGFEVNFPFILKNIEIFRQDFMLKSGYKNNIKKDLIKMTDSNSVSINIRRGDLTEFKDANITPINYYKKAIKKMEKMVKSPKYFVFSDDIGWCKKNMKFIKQATFVKDHEVYEDLELMKNCKHNILANSTLSLWAGLLNKNKGKIVIVPKAFHHRHSHEKNKLGGFPTEWIVL